MNGTVAPALAAVLRNDGVEVIPWDRRQISIEDPGAGRDFLRRERPDWFFHVATGPPQWAETVAHLCSGLAIRFLFTSSVSVFSEDYTGPYTVADTPTATDDYGRYKRDCEARIREENPEALIVRIGWQIGTGSGSNNMVDYLERTAAENGGTVAASTRWLPCCSFLPDTGAVLRDLAHGQFPPGIYHVNGNPGLTFYEIATRLNQLHGSRWIIKRDTQPARDDRLLDHRLSVPLITDRLPR